MTLDIKSLSPSDLLQAVEEAGSQREFSRQHGVPRRTLGRYLEKAMRSVIDGPVNLTPAGEPVPIVFSDRPAPQAREIAQEGRRQRFILTSAQDCTTVHEPFLRALESYRDYLRQDAPCELLIAGFTYSRKLFEDHAPRESYYDAEVRPYLVHDRVRVADKVDFCAEMNTVPTAVRPIADLQTYTRRHWGIFPHAKVQLYSVPTMLHEMTKMVMTTGAVTKPNYLPMKAGMKASFHHVYGAVLVEVDEGGSFFCRHLLGDEEDGSFYDLDRLVTREDVTTGHRLKALTPGDYHVFQIDPECARATFGLFPDGARSKGIGRWTHSGSSLLHYLRPEYLTVDDLLDFRVRNHHSISDPHDRFRLHIAGTESVEGECEETSFFLDTVNREHPETQVVVKESNHDLALLKWLKTTSHKLDPVNARFYLQCELACYQAMERGDKDFSIFQHVMSRHFPQYRCKGVTFLRENQSFMIDDVEHSLHGHNGPNGARGSTLGFAKVGPKITRGHEHSASILDGVYTSGTSSILDPSYVRGPSSWSHSHIAQYASGKRAILTMQDGRFYV